MPGEFSAAKLFRNAAVLTPLIVDIADGSHWAPFDGSPDSSRSSGTVSDSERYGFHRDLPRTKILGKATPSSEAETMLTGAPKVNTLRMPAYKLR